ncbi:hypothetical protein J3L16_12235 [Alteromonas sp. 5E99-2]|uniref:hypothetical protein n=1 Tax=Alteromonas sp. 5E99-2 TaxID=2817683 RepID=UPI001A990736|nr:hypothetical protein [Alteromonas sp. 5E99-2]MBO1256452.1 hypothetical protein [Alteromonas sp. 5E99-2]
MEEISFSQLREVNGGFGPAGAGFGALVGGVGYLGSAATSGSFSLGGFGAAVGTGALSGAVGGPVGSSVARYLLPRISFGGGITAGFFQSDD